MKRLGAEFCEVCAETIVKEIYSLIDPIDSYSPTEVSVAVSSEDTVDFAVTVLVPQTHALKIQWYIDGIIQPSKQSSTFRLIGASLPGGAHTVHVVVNDATELVRNDPDSLLFSIKHWHINSPFDSAVLVVIHPYADIIPEIPQLNGIVPDVWDETILGKITYSTLRRYTDGNDVVIWFPRTLKPFDIRTCQSFLENGGETCCSSMAQAI